MPATLAPLVANGSRELDDRRIRGYSIMGTLQPRTTSRAQAQSELDAGDAAARAGLSRRPTRAVHGEVLPLANSPRGPQRHAGARRSAILQVIMLLLLLAVCGNTANLVLARASARQREMGDAPGARRRPVAHRQPAARPRTSLLALAGAALGAAIAVWGTQALLAHAARPRLPIRFQTSIDALGLALRDGARRRLRPRSSAPRRRCSSRASIRSWRCVPGRDTPPRSRLRNTLMAVQVALALMVLVAAGTVPPQLHGDARRRTPASGATACCSPAYDLSGRKTDRGVQRARSRPRCSSGCGALPGDRGGGDRLGGAARHPRTADARLHARGPDRAPTTGPTRR